MRSSLADGPVLVAVAHPGRVEQLVRTASDLARLGSGTVQIVSIVSKPRASPVSLYSDKTIIERFAQETQEIIEKATQVAPDDVTVEREILVDRSVSEGLLTAIDRADPAAIVIGMQEGKSRTGAIIGTNIDRLIKRAPCNLYIERVGYEANGVDSILLPVAGGPHVRPAAVAAKAIAARNDATVYILSVGEAEGDTDVAREYTDEAVAQFETIPGPEISVKMLLEVGENVSDVIVETATHHDILIFGVTRQSSVRRRLVGSIPQEVVPRADKTVVLARSSEVVSETVTGRLRRLWRYS